MAICIWLAVGQIRASFHNFLYCFSCQQMSHASRVKLCTPPYLIKCQKNLHSTRATNSSLYNTDLTVAAVKST